jgi:hypothetical protein
MRISSFVLKNPRNFKYFPKSFAAPLSFLAAPQGAGGTPVARHCCKATLIERNKSENFSFSSYLNTQQDEELKRKLLHDAN